MKAEDEPDLITRFKSVCPKTDELKIDVNVYSDDFITTTDHSAEIAALLSSLGTFCGKVHTCIILNWIDV